MREAEVIYHTTADVARRIGVVPDRVRQLARSGRLQAAIVTSSGQRLFGEPDVSKLEAERRVSARAGRRASATATTCSTKGAL